MLGINKKYQTFIFNRKNANHISNASYFKAHVELVYRSKKSLFKFIKYYFPKKLDDERTDGHFEL